MLRSKNQHGFSFVESIIAVSFLGLAMMLIHTLAELTIDLKEIATTAESLQSEASEACYRFSRDTRTIREEGGLLAAEDNEVQMVNQDLQTIRYWYDVNTASLMRNDSILVEGVSAVEFSYFDEDNNQIMSPTVGWSEKTDVRLFDMKLTVTKNGSSVTLQAKARARNFL